MKKVISSVLALTMVTATLAGCSGVSGTAATTAAPAATAAAKTETSAAAKTETSAAAKAEETTAAKADAYEFKDDITIICPVKAGGDTDRNTRTLAEAMQKYTGVNVVVKNVDGGATVMGMQECLNAGMSGCSSGWKYSGRKRN
ncbi:hypothetical protein [Oribacterium sp. Sow4_G1_1]|uniref:hypothetical protein n=1 Tax=Oribacterium sp. Sow4_G1_1 TaxID=3438794 RepID=UPI003F961E95